MLRRAPERTTQERRSALEEANRVRFARAATKRRLKSGELGIYELLMDPSEELKGAKVEEVLLAVRGMAHKGNAGHEGGRGQPVQDPRRAHPRPAGPFDQGSGVRGRLIVVSGPSGAGKDTLIRAALEAIPELALIASVTTRKPRKGEVQD